MGTKKLLLVMGMMFMLIGCGNVREMEEPAANVPSGVELSSASGKLKGGGYVFDVEIGSWRGHKKSKNAQIKLTSGSPSDR